MCLSTVDRVEKIKEPLTVYKVVAIVGGEMKPPFVGDRSYKCGLNRTNWFGLKKIYDEYGSYGTKYEVGYHSFTDENDAQYFAKQNHLFRVIECTIPARTKVTFGTQRGDAVVVSRKLIFPEPPHA